MSASSVPGSALGGVVPRLALLLGVVMAFFLTYRHTVWLPRDGAAPERFALLPLSDEAWHTLGWTVFIGLLLLLLRAPARMIPARTDRALRRLAIGTVALAYAVTAWSRLATGRTFGIVDPARGAPVAAALPIALVGLAALGVLLWRPPPALWLLGGAVVAGIAARLILFRLVTPDPAFADNLPAIEMSLERLRAGLTPYAIHDFGSHRNPMPYLPFTWLAYLPAFLLGLDIRLTNLLLTTGLTLGMWWLLWRLSLEPLVRIALALAVAVLYVLPERLSKDVYSEWQLFNLLLTLAFALVLAGRIRGAAFVYGASLATMPVGFFVAPLLLVVALRTQPLREVALLVAIIGVVGGLPTLLFILWDAEAFFTAFLYGTTGLWDSLARGKSDLPLLLWHRWLGGGLLVVQALMVATATWLAWSRVRTVRGLVGLAALLYTGLIVTGPHIAQYMATVVLYLAVLAEAAGAARDTAGDRLLGRTRGVSVAAPGLGRSPAAPA